VTLGPVRMMGVGVVVMMCVEEVIKSCWIATYVDTIYKFSLTIYLCNTKLDMEIT